MMNKNKTKVVLLLSNKGGTGKSTLLTNTAYLLATLFGKKVGVIDLDFHSPDLPSMFGVESRKLGIQNKRLMPVKVLPNLYMVSYGFYLTDKKLPIIMRGIEERLVADQFINSVDWSEFDVLLIDVPANLSDGALTVVDQIKPIDGAVITTSSQDISLTDTERSIQFALQYSIPILGMVENMSYLNCPQCSAKLELYKRENFEGLADFYKLDILGRIPFEREILISVDVGVPFVEKCKENAQVESFKQITEKIHQKIFK
ncbi:MAG: P-loop NTPase [bacterium]|nr:P-loop NTPase [bacterium]